ncbi:hypothetical protein M514_25700 [Trichuris suis]|uniref:Cyclin N-terminal domain-containing protein n=1 Tax=Trichuris suis TaxID=68888 RepID=A0A085MY02_9BILA|nr:hypothetical protein M514_25700 [Trichuris suis]
MVGRAELHEVNNAVVLKECQRRSFMVLQNMLRRGITACSWKRKIEAVPTAYDWLADARKDLPDTSGRIPGRAPLFLQYLLHYLRSVIGWLTPSHVRISRLPKVAVTLLQDCYLHPVLIDEHPPQYIASAVLYVALSFCRIRVNCTSAENEREWWQIFCPSLTDDELLAVCHKILNIYDHSDYAMSASVSYHKENSIETQGVSPNRGKVLFKNRDDHSGGQYAAISCRIFSNTSTPGCSRRRHMNSEKYESSIVLRVDLSPGVRAPHLSLWLRRQGSEVHHFLLFPS